MVRSYDSSRRRQAAEQTRRDILRAALKLHWEGVTEYEPLAREAGCSVATVRKYFPTKEDLFQGCTRAFAETVEMPDLDALARIPDATQRLRAVVESVCRLHEAMFGYAWLSARLRDESETLNAEMAGYEGLTDAFAELVAPPGSEQAGPVRGMLDFLTYRALRLSGRLSADQAAHALATTLAHLIIDRDEEPGHDPQRRVQHHETE